MKSIVDVHNSFEKVAKVQAWVAEADGLIKQYGWENREVNPYGGRPVKIPQMVNIVRQYDIMNTSGREDCLEIIYNLTRLFDAWKKYADQPTVEVIRLSDNKRMTVKKEIAEFAVEEGKAVYA